MAENKKENEIKKKNCSRCENLEDCTIELSLQDENPKQFMCGNFANGEKDMENKKEFNLSEKKENLYQDLINNIEKAYDDRVNPIGIIQMFIKFSNDIDKEFIRLLKEEIDWDKIIIDYMVSKKEIFDIIDKLAGDKLI